MAIVYVLDADHGTKVGMSGRSDYARIEGQRQGSGVEFQVVRVFEFESKREASRVEKLTHYLLRADRRQGEWFWCHPIKAVSAVEFASRASWTAGLARLSDRHAGFRALLDEVAFS